MRLKKVVRDCWRIVLASVIGILPLESVQANERVKQSKETEAIQKSIQQFGLTESRAARWLIKSSADKWAIKSSEDNFKWAVKSPDDSSSLPLAKLEQSKKSTSYFRPSSSY